MSKKLLVQSTQTYFNSIFRLTFVVEVKGIDLFTDCNEGSVELEPTCTMFLKLQYQLYGGQSYIIDIFIWPQVAKVVCNQNGVWVRCWQLLERRFLAFSISHIFPVRVVQLKDFVATVTTIPGTAAHGGKGEVPTTEVYLPKLEFGDTRYFASVLEVHASQEPLEVFLWDLIWKRVIEFIPEAIMDGHFDIPERVLNGRHQDAVLYHVKEYILNATVQELTGSKVASKYGLFLTGHEILCGVGRVTPFRQMGSTSGGKIFAFLSTEFLPANDDLPVIFVNVEYLHNVPLKIFDDNRITHVYIQWTIGKCKHSSSHNEINMDENNNTVTIDDHYALTLEANANEIITNFLDNPFEIEIRGTLDPEVAAEVIEPQFFGYGKTDKNFASNSAPKIKKVDLDIPIAVTKIDARNIGKGLNYFVRGDYPLYPPKLNEYRNNREDICTNDINGIGIVQDKFIIPPSVIFECEMSLEVSIGLVGCKPRPVRNCYTRLYIIDSNPTTSMNIVRKIWETNEELAATGPNDDFLSGFAIDTGDVIIFYIEGPRDGHILKIWEIVRYYTYNIKPLFSTFAKYTARVYPELILAVPFVILKMFVPLSLILACPPVYVRPTVPLPAKSAALKLGRLLASEFALCPCSADLPTAKELQSFRLELCTPPRPPPPPIPQAQEDRDAEQEDKRASVLTIVNWNDKSKK